MMHLFETNGTEEVYINNIGILARIYSIGDFQYIEAQGSSNILSQFLGLDVDVAFGGRFCLARVMYTEKVVRRSVVTKYVFRIRFNPSEGKA